MKENILGIEHIKFENISIGDILLSHRERYRIDNIDKNNKQVNVTSTTGLPYANIGLSSFNGLIISKVTNWKDRICRNQYHKDRVTPTQQ